MPHAPQLAGLVSVLVSQPFAVLPSQFPKPELQAVIAHALLVQAGVAFGKLQVVPQAPQFVTLLVVFVSQPLVPSASQFPNPVVQATIPQVPVVQDGVACAGAQTALHAPQFARLVLVLISQPLVGFESQFAKPLLQLSTAQRLPRQTGLPSAAVQAVPQAPQLLTLFVVFTSQPFSGAWSQSSKPVLQLPTAQLPLLQA